MWLRSLSVGRNHLCHLQWDNFLWPYWWLSKILPLQHLSLPFPPTLPRSAAWQSPVWVWHNFCLRGFRHFFPFTQGLFSLHEVFIIWFFVLSLFSPLSVTGRCGLRTGVSYSPADCVSLEFLPVSHTALLFTAFRQRIKEVCHATSWIRNGVWLPFVLHRNLALGRPSA